MLEKMRIVSYKDASFDKRVVIDEFVVQVNPESYSLKYQVKVRKSQGAGSSGTNPEFDRIEPEEIGFDFLFDATGAIDGIPDPRGVGRRIKKLKSLVYDFDGGIHESAYVTLEWGELSFKGRLTEMEISYKLFRPNAVPMRAVAQCKFISAVADELRIAKENKQSPDVTHVRTIADGDTLPLLCREIYGDPSLYLEVARFNDLTDIRSLTTGSLIEFPPLEK